MGLDSPSLADDDQPTGSPVEEHSGVVGNDEHRSFRWSKRSIAVVAVSAVLAAVVAGGMLIKVPYVALVPGSVKDTEALLEIDGLREYPSEGSVFLTTVRVRNEPNVWEYLWLKTEEDAEILPEEDILGDRTPEENKEANLGLMNDSKKVAVAVALEQLGYDAVRSDAVIVSAVVEGSAADGLLAPGDIIVAIDSQPVNGVTDLIDLLTERSPGDQVAVTVENHESGSRRDEVVTLGQHPDRPDSGFLGIQPVDRLDFTNDYNFDIAIDTSSIGGPSAGLAFTLAILDDLTQGELTGGDDVAVTGMIYANGDVGAVGGVLQKTAAVRDMGIRYFIVPSQLGPETLAAMREKAGPDLEIIPVASVDEALDALATIGGNVDAVREYASAGETTG